MIATITYPVIARGAIQRRRSADDSTRRNNGARVKRRTKRARYVDAAGKSSERARYRISETRVKDSKRRNTPTRSGPDDEQSFRNVQFVRACTSASP